MKLTRKSIEKKYGVTLERGAFDMADSYKSWIAYVDDGDGQHEVGWAYTLLELVNELEENIEEIKYYQGIAKMADNEHPQNGLLSAT
ncbi:hypothetical protein [Fusobacterium varium]